MYGLPHTLPQNNNKKRGFFFFEELHKKYYYQKKEQRDNKKNRRKKKHPITIEAFRIFLAGTLYYLRLFIFLYFFFIRQYFIFIDQIYNYHSSNRFGNVLILKYGELTTEKVVPSNFYCLSI